MLLMCLQGKGLQMTYWLHGKKGFDKPLPAFDKYVNITAVAQCIKSAYGM